MSLPSHIRLIFDPRKLESEIGLGAAIILMLSLLGFPSGCYKLMFGLISQKINSEAGCTTVLLYDEICYSLTIESTECLFESTEKNAFSHVINQRT